MRKTKKIKLFPFTKGLDLSSVPGAQDPRSLRVAKNVILRNKGAVRKAPGVRSLEYTGNRSGIQAAIHYFGTTGGAQFDEIVQVRKGRVEVIRDNNIVDLGIAVSPTDTIVFERFANKLIIHFDNTRPQTYTSGATVVEDLGILSSHTSTPPTFSKKHDFSLWYGGRGNFPHRLTKSAIDNIENYSMINGGNQFRIREGDGDPVGLTGLSDTFRGDLYVFKWDSIHRIYNNGYGYGRDTVVDGVGAVHHNTIVTLKNDVYFVSPAAINSLVSTDKYGDIEEGTLSYPIYEWFQNEVNWSASKSMIATYDASSNTYLLSYAAGGSSIPNRVLGFNIVTKEFFQWEDCEYPVLGKYFDFGRKRTLVGCNEKGLGLLDEDYQTRFGVEYDFEVRTGVIFPEQEYHASVAFQKAWLYFKPTRGLLEMTFSYYIDGEKVSDTTIDLNGSGVGAQIGTDHIGSSTIKGHKEKFKPIEVDLVGDGNSIEFELKHTPNGEDDQIIEVYGLIFEYVYNEDDDTPTAA